VAPQYLAPEGVRNHYRPSELLHLLDNEIGVAHAYKPLLEAEHYEMLLFRVQLGAGEDGELVLISQRFYLGLAPEGVVLGEADAVESGILGRDDEIIRGQVAVVGERIGVGVKVD